MNKHNPVSFDPKAHAVNKCTSGDVFREAYDALDDEYAALAVLWRTQEEAGNKIGLSRGQDVAIQQFG